MKFLRKHIEIIIYKQAKKTQFFNLRQAIRPLEATIEQKGAFWVKYINENQCLKWTGSEIAITNCGEKFSVVCQQI